MVQHLNCKHQHWLTNNFSNLNSSHVYHLMEIQQIQVTILLLAIMDLNRCMDKQIFKAQAYSTIKWEWEAYPSKHKTWEELAIFMEILFRDNIWCISIIWVDQQLLENQLPHLQIKIQLCLSFREWIRVYWVTNL